MDDSRFPRDWRSPPSVRSLVRSSPRKSSRASLLLNSSASRFGSASQRTLSPQRHGSFLLKIAQLGPLHGAARLFQRIVWITFFGWTFAFGARLGRTRPAE